MHIQHQFIIICEKLLFLSSVILKRASNFLILSYVSFIMASVLYRMFYMTQSFRMSRFARIDLYKLITLKRN